MPLFVGDQLSDIVIDGYSSVSVQPHGGALEAVGLVAKVEGYANPITRELTKGTPTVGFDLGISWDMAQTRHADWNAIVSSRQADQVIATGQLSQLTLNTVFLKVGAKWMFNNKSESVFNCEAVRPGQTPTQAINFLTDIGS